MEEIECSETPVHKTQTPRKKKKKYNTDFLLCCFKKVATTDRNTTLNGRHGLDSSCSGWNSVTGNEFYFMRWLFKCALHNSNYVTWEKKMLG
jgi:hypothetical protein